MDRILLSPPDVGASERDALISAFDAGWIAPAGPELAAFEAELAMYTGAEAAVALSSGTAALHLSLIVSSVGAGDEVVVQSATFAASAFAVVHAGATPVFIDSDRSTWCLDPDLLDEFLAERARLGNLPKAVLPVDLYGSTANYGRIRSICAQYGVLVVQDAAEALGSEGDDGQAGSLGHLTALSFNGNKIITTSGGGALLGPKDLIERARFLSTQARMPVSHYEHEEIGFNYRMSNLLAALGRAQLAGLEDKISRRAQIFRRYVEAFPTFDWCPFAATPRPNHWLSVALLPENLNPAGVCAELAEVGIEARPAWKPMHQQPVFEGSEMIGDAVADELFERGICLPSGSSMTGEQLDRVIASLQAVIASEGAISA